MQLRKKRPNLLVLGAAGGVANAFLSAFHHHRHLFGTLTLVDHKRLKPRQIAHFEGLDYVFLQRRIEAATDPQAYMKVLKKHRITMVADLSSSPTLPILEATDRFGASYLNTAINDAKRHVAEAVGHIYDRRKEFSGAAHLLGSGMNPGMVNIFVRHGIAVHGTPKEVTHFEIDTSAALDGWTPLMTWSREIFLHELSKEPGGSMAGPDVHLPLLPNALSHPQEMGSILRPAIKLERYPKGYPIMHEENVSLAKRYGFPSKFLYAIDPKTMAYLKELFDRKGRITPNELAAGDNAKIPLKGSDLIGVMLDYGRKRVYYINETPNAGQVNTNATCSQVAIGVDAGLLALIKGSLKKQVYFPEDLYGHDYDDYIFSHMRVEEKVMRRKGSRWVLTKHTPMVRRRSH